jgi:hypothetical protein
MKLSRGLFASYLRTNVRTLEHSLRIVFTRAFG